MDKTAANNSREETPKGEIQRGFTHTHNNETLQPHSRHHLPKKPRQTPPKQPKPHLLDLRTTHRHHTPTTPPTILHRRPPTPRKPRRKQPRQTPPSTPQLQQQTRKRQTPHPPHQKLVNHPTGTTPTTHPPHPVGLAAIPPRVFLGLFWGFSRVFSCFEVFYVVSCRGFGAFA